MLSGAPPAARRWVRWVPILALSVRVDALVTDGRDARLRLDALEAAAAEGAGRLNAALDRMTDALAKLEGSMRGIAKDEVAISEARQWESRLAAHLAVMSEEIADLKRWCVRWGRRGAVMILGTVATGLAGLFSAKLLELLKHVLPWLAS